LRVLAYALCALLILLGLVFLVASAAGNTAPRIVIGILFVLVGGFLALFISRQAGRTSTSVVRQEIELSGDVSLEQMKCRSCGGVLESANVSVRAGAVFVTCPYCRAEYQIEEQPRW
jgi:hypothetical protein